MADSDKNNAPTVSTGAYMAFYHKYGLQQANYFLLAGVDVENIDKHIEELASKDRASKMALISAVHGRGSIDSETVKDIVALEWSKGSYHDKSELINSVMNIIEYDNSDTALSLLADYEENSRLVERGALDKDELLFVTTLQIREYLEEGNRMKNIVENSNFETTARLEAFEEKFYNTLREIESSFKSSSQDLYYGARDMGLKKDEIETYNSRRELADKFSAMSKDEVKEAVKDMSDEEVMRVYYASKAFQDRAYRMFGYNPGDKIPEKVFHEIHSTIRAGIRAGIKDEVIRGEFGKAGSNHNPQSGRNYISIEDERDARRLGSVTAHEMSHGIYDSGKIAPGFNTYYNKDTERKIYGDIDAPINLLGKGGNNGEHDNAGVEEAADSAGLKVQIVREGLYNIFNPSRMTEEEYHTISVLHRQNRLIQSIGPKLSDGMKIIGDIAMNPNGCDMNELRKAANSALSSLKDELPPPPQEQHKSSAASLAASNFQMEMQEEQSLNRGLRV